MKSLKLLVFTLSVAMLMAVSACATPPPPPTPVPMPMLTEEEAVKIVRTYIGHENSRIKAISEKGWSVDLPFTTCFTGGSLSDALHQEASYK